MPVMSQLLLKNLICGKNLKALCLDLASSMYMGQHFSLKCQNQRFFQLCPFIPMECELSILSFFIFIYHQMYLVVDKFSFVSLSVIWCIWSDHLHSAISHQMLSGHLECWFPSILSGQRLVTTDDKFIFRRGGDASKHVFNRRGRSVLASVQNIVNNWTRLQNIKQHLVSNFNVMMAH